MLPGKTYGPQDFISLARHWWWLLIGPPVVGLFAALVVGTHLPNIYRSEMLIQIVPQRVPDSFVTSTITIRTEERVDALFRELTSRTGLERLIRREGLYPEETARLPIEYVVDIMRANLAYAILTGRGRSASAEAFSMSFTYPDPRIAAQVAQRLGSLIVDQNARDRGALVDGTNQFLESQLDSARLNLETQEQRLEQFRVRNSGRLPTQLQANMQAIQSAQLQLQTHVESLARDRDRRLILERMYNDATEQPVPVATAPGAQLSDTDTMASEPALEFARATLARLMLRLTPEHPDIRRTQRLVADLEKQVEAAAAQPLDAAAAPAVPMTREEQARGQRLGQMRLEIENLDRQIAFKESDGERIRGTVREYQDRIEAVPGIESEWLLLVRDYDTSQAMYEDILVKSEASKMAAELERRQIGEQFRVLDQASVPTRPIAPDRLRINGLAAGGGLLLGVGLVALIALSDSTFRTETDIKTAFGLPVLALLPYVESALDRRRRRRRLVLGVTGTSAAIAGGGYVFFAMELWKYVA